MELLAILWVAYVIYIATRSQKQQQNHLLLVWGTMAFGCLYALGKALF